LFQFVCMVKRTDRSAVMRVDRWSNEPGVVRHAYILSSLESSVHATEVREGLRVESQETSSI
jgi:hypothetical protein